MAKMIPTALPLDTPSPGERLVFQRLKEDPRTASWIVLHSYALPPSLVERRREADFVVLVPGRGVCALEVKAHSYVARTSSGGWVLGKEGEHASDPVHQATNCAYRLRRFLQQLGFPGIKVAPFLLFTHVSVDTAGVREIAEVSLGSGPSAVQDLPPRILAAIDFEQGDASFSYSAGKIADALRPQFEALLSPVEQHAYNEADLRAATAEQAGCLDLIECNDRILLTGPAGCGKTSIALEHVRRSALQGQRVLLTCFNKHLGHHLQEQCLGSTATAGSLHKLLSEWTGVSAHPPIRPNFWGDLVQTALASGALPQYDLLVVDEVQDLLTPAYTPLLDALVKGGLAEGRWLCTGDVENQTVQNTYTQSSTPLLEGRPVQVRLRKNCRNTRSVGSYVETVAQRPGLYDGYRRQEAGTVPTVRVFTLDEGMVRAVSTTVEHLLSQRYSPSEITVLVEGDTEATLLQTRAGLRSYASGSDRTTCETIRKFKGLESAAIIAVVRASTALDLLYTALTRSTGDVTLVVPAEDATTILERLELLEDTSA